jgi:ribosome biogenesis GTPase A
MTQPTIQWYPGHIAKVERELKQHLQKVDVVVEVRDARLPMATENPNLQQAIAAKARVLVLNKTDLADPGITTQWLDYFAQAPYYAGIPTLGIQPGQSTNALINAMLKADTKRQQADKAKGLKPRPVRVLIAGMPNVGKSSIINRLVGKKRLTTGHKAGVTRQMQWVRIHPQVDLMDSPGIIPPRLASEEAGALLACVSSVGDAAFDDIEVSGFLLHRLEAHYPGVLASHYQCAFSPDLANLVPNLEAMAVAQQLLKKGGIPDLHRAAQRLLKDYRQGALGRLSLETSPPSGDFCP